MKYITDKQKKQRWLALFLLVILISAGIGYLLGTMAEAEDRWPGEIREYPMANTHISWEQTFRGGAWE